MKTGRGGRPSIRSKIEEHFIRLNLGVPLFSFFFLPMFFDVVLCFLKRFCHASPILVGLYSVLCLLVSSTANLKLATFSLCVIIID